MTSPSRFLVHLLAYDGLLSVPVRSYQITADNELAALAQGKDLALTNLNFLPTNAVQVLNGQGPIMASWRVPLGFQPT